MDAVLGALAQPDIGMLFPDTDAAFTEIGNASPFAATNPQRVALFRACRVCPNATGETDHD